MKTNSHKHSHFPWSYFFAALAIFCLGHWLGGQVMHGVEQLVPVFEEVPWLLTLLSMGVLIGLSIGLRYLHHERPRPKTKLARFCQFLLAVGVLISAFIVAVSFEHFLEHGPLHLANHSLGFAFACVVLLLITEPFFRNLQTRLERLRDIHPLLHLREEKEEPLEAMILFVSTPNASFQTEVTAEGPRTKVQFVNSGDRLLKGRGHLEEDIAELSRDMKKPEYWNWQQLMRALRGHTKLRHVILIGSETEKGSHKDLSACGKVLQPYLPEGCTITPHAQPLNFTDFNAMVETLRHIILHELKALPRNRIAIDVTGGLTTASIAGAATTMNLECVFQYVSTMAPNDTFTYDVLHESGPHLH